MHADRAFLEGFAAGAGLRLDLDGEIGFGRECVGLLDSGRETYLAWGEGCEPKGAPDAYHKSDYVAVLGRSPDAIAQLAAWVRSIVAEPFVLVYRPKDVPDLSTLVYGYSDELYIARPARARATA